MLIEGQSHSQRQSLAAAVELLRSRLPGLRAVYLFGSRASGTSHSESDYDFAVLADAVIGSVESVELAEDLAAQLGGDVDLVDLATASTVLRSQVVGNGTPLYLDGGMDLEATLDLYLADYARLNEERAEILADIRSRGNIHG